MNIGKFNFSLANVQHNITNIQQNTGLRPPSSQGLHNSRRTEGATTTPIPKNENAEKAAKSSLSSLISTVFRQVHTGGKALFEQCKNFSLVASIKSLFPGGEVSTTVKTVAPSLGDVENFRKDLNDGTKANLFTPAIKIPQKANCQKIRSTLINQMDLNYKRTENGCVLNPGRASTKGISWKPDTSNQKDIIIKGFSKGSTKEKPIEMEVTITKEMIKDQQKNTKISIIKNRGLTGKMVQNAALNGAKAEDRDAMRNRCVASPIYMFANAKGEMIDGEPVRVIACVMSADNRAEVGVDKRLFTEEEANLRFENNPEKKEANINAIAAYKEELREGHQHFIHQSIASGADHIVDCGFGQGAFSAGSNEVCFPSFVETWVTTMTEALKENPELYVTFAGHSTIGPMIEAYIEANRDTLDLNPDVLSRLTITPAISNDVAILAAQNGFIPSLRIAADSSGVAGQHTVDIDPDNMNDVAQDEVAGCTSTLILPFVQTAKVSEWSPPNLT